MLFRSMSKPAMIRVRIDPDLKKEAERILAKLGLSPNEAIGLLYRQVLRRGGLPFEVSVANAVTRAAINEARSGNKLESFKKAADLIRKAGA